MSKLSKPVHMVLIADDAYRVAMLRRLMRRLGVSGQLKRLAPTAKAKAYLQRQTPFENAPLPDLVLFDLAELRHCDRRLLSALVFGERRTTAPVVLLTSPATEAMLENGELDSGNATMFSPRKLKSFLTQLAGRHSDDFLKALTTLYQYGPILARQPARFLDSRAREVAICA